MTTRGGPGLVAALLLMPIVPKQHEAMFGPQSAAVLSPTIFVSEQVLDQEEGQGDQEHEVEWQFNALKSTGRFR